MKDNQNNTNNTETPNHSTVGFNYSAEARNADFTMCRRLYRLYDGVVNTASDLLNAGLNSYAAPALLRAAEQSQYQEIKTATDTSPEVDLTNLINPSRSSGR